MKGVTVILLTAVLALGRCEHHEHTLENVALKGKAVQSSTYGSAYARRAIMETAMVTTIMDPVAILRVKLTPGGEWTCWVCTEYPQ
uniref:Uncharacterized protein n=1 Tax=Anguilla anguilla TaxID=7936 RepID=A0A0E9XVM7_ANGAN